jgi:aarF domain-containing kinase
VIERLGPAYVKVAQAMSTRVDLLSPEYYMQIQLLQDRVPPFPCEQAKEVRAVRYMTRACSRCVKHLSVTSCVNNIFLRAQQVCC